MRKIESSLLKETGRVFFNSGYTFMYIFSVCCYTVHVPTNMSFGVNVNDRIYKCMYMLCFDKKIT